jgi:hypothetical protein
MDFDVWCILTVCNISVCEHVNITSTKQWLTASQNSYLFLSVINIKLSDLPAYWAGKDIIGGSVYFACDCTLQAAWFRHYITVIIGTCMAFTVAGHFKSHRSTCIPVKEIQKKFTEYEQRSMMEATEGCIQFLTLKTPPLGIYMYFTALTILNKRTFM